MKQIKKEALGGRLLLIEKIRRSEEQINEGKFIRVDTSMSDKEIDDLLMIFLSTHKLYTTSK